MPRPTTLLKKRLWQRCFPVNFAKFLRTPFSHNTAGQLLLNFWSQACNVIKIEALAQVFSSEFCAISKNNFSYRTPPVAASAKMYSETCQKVKIKTELFAKIVDDWKSLTIFVKASSEMLDKALNTPL